MGDARRAARAAAFLTCALPLASLGIASGGYYPREWRLATVGFAAVVVAALVLREAVVLSRLELALLAALAGLAAWTAASALWSQAPSQSLLEAERSLLYLVGVGAVLLVARPGAAGPLLGGTLAAIATVVGYGTAYHLLGERAVDPFEGVLLFHPLGYANALAIFAGLGALLALGIAASPRGAAAPAAAAALVVLLAAVALTSSRGAAVAILLGLAAFVGLAPDRAQLAWRLVLPGAAAAAAFAAARLAGLHEVETAADRAAGLLLALALAVLAAVSAAVTRLELPRAAARRAVAVAGVLAVAAGGLWAAADGTLAAGNRPLYWRVGWEAYASAPWLGTGAGTYEYAWAAAQPVDEGVRDAHSLYVESLAELGPVGLLLVLAALALPLVAALRRRGGTLVAAGAAAYAAFLVHAGLDWDWEMPAVTLAGLFAGASLLVSARGDTGGLALPPRARWPALALALVACALALARLASA